MLLWTNFHNLDQMTLIERFYLFVILLSYSASIINDMLEDYNGVVSSS